MKKTLILQCPGMVCSPPVVSKCLGEAHRRLDIIYIIYITLHYITLHYITLHYINSFFFSILLVICYQFYLKWGDFPSGEGGNFPLAW